MGRTLYIFWLAMTFIGLAAADGAQAQGRRLQPSDQLQVRVLNQPDLDAQVRVAPDGTISLPHLGRVRVSGMTEDGLAGLYRRALQRRDIVKNAEVLVSTVTFGAQVSVLGAVRSPGIQVMDRPTTLAEAVSRAGGAVQPAGTIIVRRSARGGTQVTRYDQEAVLTGRGPAANPYVANGDQIYVEEAPVYYLYGYINRPGAYPLTRPLTVQQALATGGGLAALGSEWRIDIKRKKPDGQIETTPAILDEIIRPNDTIVVKERFF
jgi:polysaccharide export outer membrane protein